MRQPFDARQGDSRRRFLRITGTGLISLALAGCGNKSSQADAGAGSGPVPAEVTAASSSVPVTPASTSKPNGTPRPSAAPAPTATPDPKAGRLGARPSLASRAATGSSGRHRLGLAADRDALLYVPPGNRADRLAPMVLLLHGAGGNAEAGLSLLQPLADAANLVLLAAPSRGQTWDVIINDYGPDVELIDRALAETFNRYAIDSEQLAIGGFSDGASYALSLGLTNGDLFTHVIAFSPGFMAPRRPAGKPHVFISHGIHDDVLPIDVCSRRIVPQLERAGYDVRYREFDGPHTVPPEIAGEAVDWFTASQGAASPSATETP